MCDYISLYQNNHQLLTLGRSLTKETMIGMIAAWSAICRETLVDFPHYNYSIVCEKNGNVSINEGEGIFTYNPKDDLGSLFPTYQAYSGVDKNFSFPFVVEVDYLWPIADEKGTYTIYRFSSPEFIQGFITGIDSFNLDFRNFAYGLPYKIHQNHREYFNIEGYDIALITPFDDEGPRPFITDGNPDKYLLE